MAVGILPSSSQILDAGRLDAYKPLTAVLNKQRKRQPRDADFHTTASAPPPSRLAPSYTARRREWARRAMWERLSLDEAAMFQVGLRQGGGTEG